MSVNFFESICYSLIFTDPPPLPIELNYIKHKKWLLHGMVTLKKIFIPSWISRLYESISVWMSKFMCPGFVFCPCMPHPKGNEYHTIYCVESSIIYGWKIVEVRDHPISMGGPEFGTTKNMNTVGIMLWITQVMCRTGKAVLMGSGLCVFKWLLEMRNRGVYGIALIKKAILA